MPPLGQLNSAFEQTRIFGRKIKPSTKYSHLQRKEDALFEQLLRTMPSNVPFRSIYRCKWKKVEVVHCELSPSGRGCLKIIRHIDHDLKSPEEFKELRESCKGALFRAFKALKENLNVQIVTEEIFVYVYWETDEFESLKNIAHETTMKLVGTKLYKEIKEEDALFVSKKFIVFLTQKRLSRYGRTKLIHSQFYASNLFFCIELFVNHFLNVDWSNLQNRDWDSVLFQLNPYIVAGNFRITSTVLNGSARHCFLFLDKLLMVRERYKAQLLRLLHSSNLGYFELLTLFMIIKWLPIRSKATPPFLNIERVPRQLDEESLKIVNYLSDRMKLFRDQDLHNQDGIDRYEQLIQYRGGDVVSGIVKGIGYSSGRNNHRVENKLIELERAKVIVSYRPSKAKGIRRNGKVYAISIDKSSLKEIIEDLIQSILRTE